MAAPHTAAEQALFVYYKVEPQQHDSLLRKGRGFAAAAMQQWDLLEVELLQRPQPNAQGLETWMEVYRHPEGVTEAMMGAIAQLAIEHGMPPVRLNEIFIPLQNK